MKNKKGIYLAWKTSGTSVNLSEQNNLNKDVRLLKEIKFTFQIKKVEENLKKQ